jgi:hypothetical protein
MEERGSRRLDSGGLGESMGGDRSVLVLMGDVSMVAMEGSEDAYEDEESDTESG